MSSNNAPISLLVTVNCCVLQKGDITYFSFDPSSLPMISSARPPPALWHIDPTSAPEQLRDKIVFGLHQAAMAPEVQQVPTIGFQMPVRSPSPGQCFSLHCMTS
jgi:hypothetical protein